MGHVTPTMSLLGVVCHPKADCVQNLTILASAIPEISLGTTKFKMRHMTLTTPLLRVICHPCGETGYRLPVHKI